VSVSVGWSRVDVHVADRITDTWNTVVAGVEANTALSFTADDAALVGITTLDAPRGRVVQIPLEREQIALGPAQWQTLVAERAHVITPLRVARRGLHQCHR